jgi:hypothetical protein
MPGIGSHLEQRPGVAVRQDGRKATLFGLAVAAKVRHVTVQRFEFSGNAMRSLLAPRLNDQLDEVEQLIRDRTLP